MKIKIKDLVGDLTYEGIKKRKWRHPRIWRNGKKIVFKKYVISEDGIVLLLTKGNQYSYPGKIKKFSKTSIGGYIVSDLTSNEGEQIKSILLHRLLWETWIGRIPKNKEINHKDGNKENNDIFHNLELLTHIENINHAKKNGLSYTEEWKKKISAAQKGKIIPIESRKKMSESARNRKPVSQETRKKMSDRMKGKRMYCKLSEKEIHSIRRLSYCYGSSFNDLSMRYNVSVSCINHIVQGTSWNPNKLTKNELRKNM